MGWWHTSEGTLGDDPADRLGDWLTALPAQTSPGALLRLLEEALSDRPFAYLQNPGALATVRIGLFAREGQRLQRLRAAGPAWEAPPLRAARLAFRGVRTSYQDVLARGPTLAELLGSLSFVLRPTPGAYLAWPAGWSFDEISCAPHEVAPLPGWAAPGAIDWPAFTVAPYHEKLAAAAHPDTPSALLLALCEDGAELLQIVIARRPHLPEEVLRDLATRGGVSAAKTARERLALGADYDRARDPSTAPEVLLALARHPRRRVRRAALLHPNAPPALWSWLAGAGDPLDRAWVASRPEATQEALDLCTFDRDARVLHAAAAAPKLAPEKCAALYADGDPPLRAAVTRRISEDPHWMARFLRGLPSWEQGRALEQHPATPALTRAILAETPPPHAPYAIDSLLRTIAHSPRTPQESLWLLARAGLPGLWDVLAANRAASHDLLRFLVERALLAPDARYLQANLAVHPNLPEDAFEQLWQHRDPELEMTLARYPRLAPEKLSTLWPNAAYGIGAILALHPHAPPELLARLAAEDQPDINRALKQRARWPKPATH